MGAQRHLFRQLSYYNPGSPCRGEMLACLLEFVLQGSLLPGVTIPRTRGLYWMQITFRLLVTFAINFFSASRKHTGISYNAYTLDLGMSAVGHACQDEQGGQQQRHCKTGRGKSGSRLQVEGKHVSVVGTFRPSGVCIHIPPDHLCSSRPLNDRSIPSQNQ